MFTPTPSTDGYGDREDIANARDFSHRAAIAETQRQEQRTFEAAIEKAREFGTASNAKPITAIVLEMLEHDCYEKLLLKSEIVWDVESIHEAVTDACINLGLSDEEFSASYHDQGNEIDLRLL